MFPQDMLHFLNAFYSQEVAGPFGNPPIANSGLQSVRTRNLLLLLLNYQSSDEVKTDIHSVSSSNLSGYQPKC